MTPWGARPRPLLAPALDVPLVLPATWPGATPVFAQFATLDPSTNAISTTGSLTLVGRY